VQARQPGQQKGGRTQAQEEEANRVKVPPMTKNTPMPSKASAASREASREERVVK
jgi:hypothetical protein